MGGYLPGWGEEKKEDFQAVERKRRYKICKFKY